MLRTDAVLTLLAVAAPMVPLHAGHRAAHDRCPMAGDDCTRTVAFSCCGAGEAQNDPAVTCARTTVKDVTKLATPALAWAIALPAYDLDAAISQAARRHVPPRRQRLAQLSILLI
jgi:hypothetical protein